jgi:hypothetical protein
MAPSRVEDAVLLWITHVLSDISVTICNRSMTLSSSNSAVDGSSQTCARTRKKEEYGAFRALGTRPRTDGGVGTSATSR